MSVILNCLSPSCWVKESDVSFQEEREPLCRSALVSFLGAVGSKVRGSAWGLESKALLSSLVCSRLEWGRQLAKVSVKPVTTHWSKGWSKAVVEGIRGPRDPTPPAAWPVEYFSACHLGVTL